MSYEVILPMPVTMEAVMDQMAHAVWRVLGTTRAGVGLYPGYFVPMRQAIEEHLMRMLLEEEDLGAARGYRFSGGPGDGERLEDGIVRAVISRLPGLLGDVRVAEVFSRDVPVAMHSVLEPFLWFEGDDQPAEPAGRPHVPGPRAGSRRSGDAGSTAGAT